VFIGREGGLEQNVVVDEILTRFGYHRQWRSSRLVPVQAGHPARRVKRRLRRLLISSDVLAIVVGVVAATVVQQLVNPVERDVLADEAVLGVLAVPIWVVMMGANNLFLARAVSQFEEELRRLFVTGLMAIGFLVAVLFLAQYEELSRLWVALLFVCVTSSLVVSRMFARQVFNNLRRDGRIGDR
jgi:drug/metabolite transporter (DMT)-like permease